MSSDDPLGPLRQRLAAVQLELRQAIGDVDDPQGKALLEVAAEVVGGLRKAFVHYKDKSEPAWQQMAKRIFP